MIIAIPMKYLKMLIYIIIAKYQFPYKLKLAYPYFSAKHEVH